MMVGKFLKTFEVYERYGPHGLLWCLHLRHDVCMHDVCMHDVCMHDVRIDVCMHDVCMHDVCIDVCT